MVTKLAVMSSEGLAPFPAEWHAKDRRGTLNGQGTGTPPLLLPGIAGSPKHQVTTYCRVILNRSETLKSALTSTASVPSLDVVYM